MINFCIMAFVLGTISALIGLSIEARIAKLNTNSTSYIFMKNEMAKTANRYYVSGFIIVACADIAYFISIFIK